MSASGSGGGNDFSKTLRDPTDATIDDLDPASSGPITKPTTQRGGSNASWLAPADAPESIEPESIIDSIADVTDDPNVDLGFTSVTPTTPGMPPLRVASSSAQHEEDSSPHTIRSGSWTAGPVNGTPVVIIPPIAPIAPVAPVAPVAPATEPSLPPSDVVAVAAKKKDLNATAMEPVIRRKLASETNEAGSSDAAAAAEAKSPNTIREPAIAKKKKNAETLLEPAIAKRKVVQMTAMEPAIAKAKKPPPLPTAAATAFAVTGAATPVEAAFVAAAAGHPLAETIDKPVPSRKKLAPTLIEPALAPPVAGVPMTVDNHTVMLPARAPSVVPPASTPSSQEMMVAKLHWEDSSASSSIAAASAVAASAALSSSSRSSSAPPPNVTVLLRAPQIQAELQAALAATGAATPFTPVPTPASTPPPAGAGPFDVEVVENAIKNARYRDAIRLGEDQAMLVMTDFGASAMSVPEQLIDRLRRVVRNAASRGDGPDAILQILNREIEEVGLTAAATCARVDLKEQMIVVASAGAAAPFILRNGEGDRMIRGSGEGSVALGRVHSATFAERSLHFERNDMFVLGSTASVVALDRLFAQPTVMLKTLKGMRSVDWLRQCTPPGASILALTLR